MSPVAELNCLDFVFVATGSGSYTIYLEKSLVCCSLGPFSCF